MCCAQARTGRLVSLDGLDRRIATKPHQAKPIARNGMGKCLSVCLSIPTTVHPGAGGDRRGGCHVREPQRGPCRPSGKTS